MKTLFEQNTADEIIQRIDNLSPQSQRQWGKMDVSQMLAHCSAALEVASGQKHLPRMFIGRILGPIFKSKFYDDKPFDKNSPTAESFTITDQRNFDKEKQNLKQNLEKFSKGGTANCTKHPHTFFGKLSAE